MNRQVVIVMNIVFVLVLIGILMSYSAGIGRPSGQGRLGDFDDLQYLRVHLVYVGIGLMGMFLAARFDYHRLASQPVRLVLMLITVAMLGMVLLYGAEINGARRWIKLFGLTFQPSELAKLTLVVLLAAKLSENQDSLHRFWSGFIPPMIITFFLAALVLAQRDLGTPFVMGVVAMLMIFMAGGRLSHAMVTGVPSLALVFLLIAGDPERRDRVTAFLDPWEHRQTAAMQLIESQVGFVGGGLWGKGLGGGEQKLHWLPAAHSDFIFSVWGEEMGLAGTLALVGLFMGFLAMAMYISGRAPDLLGFLLSGGAATLLTVQAGTNMAVTTGLLPTKGLALPFISAGGSSLIVSLILVGVILNVGLQTVEEDRSRPRVPSRGRPAWSR